MTDHKAVAEALVALVADAAAPPLPADAANLVVVGQAATAHALLALAEKVDEVAEQLRVANVIAAFDPPSADLIHVHDQQDAEIYIQAAVRRILTPSPERGEDR